MPNTRVDRTILQLECDSYHKNEREHTAGCEGASGGWWLAAFVSASIFNVQSVWTESMLGAVLNSHVRPQSVNDTTLSAPQVQCCVSVP